MASRHVEPSVLLKMAHKCREGSVFPKSLMWALPAASVAAIGNLFYGGEDQISSKLAANLGNFTFILGFMIVFRSQQAFSRWWEGGTIMQQLRAEWFNAYSSVLAFTNEGSEDVAYFVYRLVHLMSLLYGSALESTSTGDHGFSVLELDGIDADSLNYLKHSHSRPEVVLQWVQRLIVQAEGDGILKVAPPILSRIYQQLGNGLVNLTNARKIKDLQIPLPIRQTVYVLLLIHLCTSTFIAALTSQNPIEAAISSFVNVFAFWSVHFIATELENPYGNDANDLPLEHMIVDYNNSLLSLLSQYALSPPHFDNTNPVVAGTFSLKKLAVQRGSTDDWETVGGDTEATRRCEHGAQRAGPSERGVLGLNNEKAPPVNTLSAKGTPSRGINHAVLVAEQKPPKAMDAADGPVVIESKMDRTQERLLDMDDRPATPVSPSHESRPKSRITARGAQGRARVTASTSTVGNMQSIDSSIMNATKGPVREEPQQPHLRDAE